MTTPTPETDAMINALPRTRTNESTQGELQLARKCAELERQRIALAAALRILIIEVVANCQHANFMSDETGEALNKANSALAMLEGKS